MKVEAAARPMEALRAVERAYPRIWDMASVLRAAKGEPDIGDWPDYCWLPMSGWSAITGPRRNVKRLPVVAAIGTWRLSKGIYCYDEDLTRELIGTPMGEQTPTAVFYNLPEFCVYIDTPYNPDYSGFFAHLEYDFKPNRRYSPNIHAHSELRLLYLPRVRDILDNSVQVMLHIDNKSIIDSLREIYGVKSSEVLDNINGELSMLLYLCSEEPDYGDRQPPAYAQPTRIKGRYKWIPKQKPEIWDIGIRLGAAIRRYQASERHAEGAEPIGRTVRPHIRRAHWHGFWTGPRKEPARQRFVHKWIPPIPVNVAADAEGELPAVVRTVKK